MMESKFIYVDKAVYFRRAYSAEYYKKNKEHISRRNAERVECPKCFKNLGRANLSRHLKNCNEKK
jgi:hypothetical protein